MSGLESRKENLQQHLLLIRRCLGWSAKELGDRIGVQRQTINYLEANKNERYKLSTTQYLAIRKVLDDELASSSNDMDMLQTVLEVLVDNPEKYQEDEREKVLSKANRLAPAVLAKSSTREEVSADFKESRKSGLLGLGVMALKFALPVAAMVMTSLSGSKSPKED